MVWKLFAVRNQFLEDCSGKLRLFISNELSLGRAGDGYLRRWNSEEKTFPGQRLPWI